MGGTGPRTGRTREPERGEGDRGGRVRAALALGGCGGGEDRKPPRIDAFSPVEQRVGARGGPPRASPRWERVAKVAGRGPHSQRVSIAGGAIQWLAVAGQAPQGTERRRRHEARAKQAGLEQPTQPLGVGDVGLSARELLDVLGVDQEKVEAILEAGGPRPPPNGLARCRYT